MVDLGKGWPGGVRQRSPSCALLCRSPEPVEEPPYGPPVPRAAARRPVAAVKTAPILPHRGPVSRIRILRASPVSTVRSPDPSARAVGAVPPVRGAVWP